MSMPDQAPPTLLKRCTDLGYEHHVFISWPHQIESRGAAFVRALAAGLEDRFKTYGGGSVFIDDRLVGGYRWNADVRKRLCRSAVVVSVIVPTFFLSEYCGIEWSIAEQLQTQRLPANEDVATLFLPIVLTGGMQIPVEVDALEPVADFMPVLAHARSIQNHPKWNLLLQNLRERIFDRLALVVATKPDWPAAEALALSAQPKRFTWQPSKYAPSASKGRLSFPGFVVEPRMRSV